MSYADFEVNDGSSLKVSYNCRREVIPFMSILQTPAATATILMPAPIRDNMDVLSTSTH